MPVFSRVTLLASACLALFCGCHSYITQLLPTPTPYRVIAESLVLTDADDESASPIAVLMRGDTVMVLGERSERIKYELDDRERYHVVEYKNRKAYVAYDDLVTLVQYDYLYRPVRPGDTATAPTTVATTGTVTTGGTVSGRTGSGSVTRVRPGH